jgi:Flp pilus assembly protein TadG
MTANQDGTIIHTASKSTAFRRWLRCRLGDTRGAVAIEFAIMMPMLITVLFGIIQYGLILNTRQLMTYAAREAARSYAIGESTSDEAQALAITLLNNATYNYATDLTDDGTSVQFDITLPMAEAALVNALETSLMSGNIAVSVTMRLEE